MDRLAWWLRIVGAFYVLQAALILVFQAPIRAQGPTGTIALISAGDPVAHFLVDTWITFALEIGAIGVALIIFARTSGGARTLVWTALAIEFARGLIADIVLLARGESIAVLGPWLAIHSVIIATGLFVLRKHRPIIPQERESLES